jgi:VIT1/CCC1 family predicted Fe2+/Mn2+ transporter
MMTRNTNALDPDMNLPSSGMETKPDRIGRYRRNLQAELDSAGLYQAMADRESAPELATVYRRLAATEQEHAAFWREHLSDLGVLAEDIPTTPTWRARILIRLTRLLGAATVLPTVTELESADAERYTVQSEARGAGLPATEQSHARLFTAMMGGTPAAGMSGPAIARLEGRHRTGGNALRAAVLGANDGLVSNMSLVMGVAGADLASRSVLVTGLAGLLAGSLSMALGEWLSVQSARELYAHQIRIEAGELEARPEEEAEELSLIYQAKGIPAERASELAQHLVSDRDTALDTLAREELGLDPEELGGSAWIAALTSFLLFSIGAIVPVVAYFVLDGMTAVWTSIALSLTALFLIGAAITVITGQSAWKSGGRQVIFGGAAAAITFGVGRLLDAGLL